MAKRRAAISYHPGSVEPIIRLWLLRVLVPLGGYRQFVHQHGFNNDIFVYNAGFEMARIRDLAQRFPRLSEALLALNERVVDLLGPGSALHHSGSGF